MPRPDQYPDIESILTSRSYEEDAAISDQDAESMRFHAKGLRARARYFEDKGEVMAPISLRWLRTVAKALEQGADAKELFDA